MTTLYAQLMHFGLSDKEAKVYTSALELGPSPVQVISRKAGVNRATTYVQIASLTGRGLMSSYEQGKKRFFVAEAPDRLAALYEDELQHLRDKERILKDILPELKRLRPSEGIPAVRLFEGHEGLETVRQELLQSGVKVFSEFIGQDYYTRAVPEASKRKQFERVKAAGIRGRIIISIKDSASMKRPEGTTHLMRRAVSADVYDAPGEIAVFDNKVVMLSYRGDPVAIQIESPELAKVVLALFNLAWEKVKVDREV